MAKYIKKKDLKRAIDDCTWYHINRNGDLAEGANPDYHEPLYKYSDIKRIIKGLPTKKIVEQTEPQKTTDYCDTCNHKGCENCVGDNSNPYCVPSRYEPKGEPNCSEKPNNCETCKHQGNYDYCRDCYDFGLYETDEPQTDCPYREYPCDVCDRQTDCPWK